MRKKYLILAVFCLSTFLFSSLIFAQSNKDKETKKLHIEEFSESIGKPIDSGFVFFDGQYIEAPYTVTRKGLAVYINDKMIEKPIPWPPKAEPVGDIDPKLPKEITKETSIYDKVFINYIQQKRAYIQKHYTSEEERIMMEEVYKNLPFVKEAYIDKMGRFAIVTCDNKVHNPSLVAPRRKPKLDQESVLKRLENKRKNLEDRLQKGDTYFFFSQGGHISFGAGNTKEKLPKIVKALRSPKPIKDKYKDVQESGLPMVSEKDSSAIVTNFSASYQLEERLEKLKETDVVEKR